MLADSLIYLLASGCTTPLRKIGRSLTAFQQVGLAICYSGYLATSTDVSRRYHA
jgi:hypothetical protein